MCLESAGLSLLSAMDLKDKRQHNSQSLQQNELWRDDVFSSDSNLLQKQVTFQGDCLQGLWMLILMERGSTEVWDKRVYVDGSDWGALKKKTTPSGWLKSPSQTPLLQSQTHTQACLLAYFCSCWSWNNDQAYKSHTALQMQKTCLITYPEHHARWPRKNCRESYYNPLFKYLCFFIAMMLKS